MNKELLDYFEGDELAANVWLSKYAQEGEITPDDMHKRMAKEFTRIEEKYYEAGKQWLDKGNLSDYGSVRSHLQENDIYELFKNFKYVIPQGSVMSNLGSKAITSLSNCFVIGQPSDSYGGIFQKDEEMVQLMKRRGGVGIDISTLRPKGTDVTNAAKTSTGAVSFMHRFSNSTREVAQDGRRGALMLSISINHPDVMDFIKIKRDLTQVTGANISIKLNNEFMEAVENNNDYYLSFPCTEKNIPLFENLPEYNILIKFNGKYYKRIKAKEYWDEIIKSAHNVAEPGLMFEDNHINYSPDGVYEQYRGITTNPCFSGDMRLLTAYGYKTFKELEGKEIDLIDHENNVKQGRVVKTGDKPIFVLKLSNGKIIKTTIDHKFVNTERKEIEAQYLKEGKHRLLVPYEINDEINEFVKYGFLQGDGCLGRLNSDKHLGLEINIGEKDLDVAEIFNLESEGKHYISGFNATLKELGFDSNQLPYRNLPLTINNWSKDNLSMFLKGLWSANGGVIKGQRISFKSTCKTLIEGLKSCLKINYNIDSYITTNKAKNIQFSNGNYLCKESYDLNISTLEGVISFAKEIGFVHKYKQISLEELILAKCPLVISSKIDKVEEVFDFQIDSDKHWGIVEGVVVHNCGEIFMQEYDACRLIAVNLISFVDNPFTKEARFNFDKFYKINYEAMRLSDDLVDLELEHIDRIIQKIEDDKEIEEVKDRERRLWEKIRETAQSSRRTGLGVTALGDCLAALGLKYDSDEALEMINKIFSKKLESELDCTIDLSILRGSFVGWNKDKEYFDNEDDITIGNNDFYKMLQVKFPNQYLRMYEFGRRNVSFNTCAPTGTVSLLANNCTGGIEPLFQPFYFRRKKINPNDKNSRVDFTDQNGDNWQEFPVLHPYFKQWILTKKPDFDFNITTKEELGLWFTQSPWFGSTANDINWLKRVEIQGIIQKYITHSISSTINLPKDVTEEEVSNIYMESWKKGLKGVTVYRDGSRSGVLITDNTKSNNSFEYKDALKRPKSLKCDIHSIVSKGVKWNVIIGLLDEKPYEVFAVKHFTDEHKLELLKIKQGRYDLLKDGETYSEDITSEMNSEEEIITRLVSTGLRHGTDVKFLVEQLNKAGGDITSFGKAISRILKKYIPEGAISTVKCNDCGSSNVIFKEGCQSCADCGSSKCS